MNSVVLVEGSLGCTVNMTISNGVNSVYHHLIILVTVNSSELSVHYGGGYERPETLWLCALDIL